MPLANDFAMPSAEFLFPESKQQKCFPGAVKDVLRLRKALQA
jgi:hypothetical protein